MCKYNTSYAYTISFIVSEKENSKPHNLSSTITIHDMLKIDPPPHMNTGLELSTVQTCLQFQTNATNYSPQAIKKLLSDVILYDKGTHY